MVNEPGRSSLPPLRRAVTVISELRAAGRGGVLGAELADRAGYQGEDVSKREQLKRDINKFKDSGWTIENIAAPGTPARYQLEEGDPRIRVALSADAVAEFARAAAAAGVGSAMVSASVGTAAPAVRLRADRPAYALSLVHHGFEHRCLLAFVYNDEPRRVIPDAVWRQYGRWYLRGRLVGPGWVDGDGPEGVRDSRTFRLDRISSLELAPPGTAGPADAGAEIGVDALTFPDGEPFDAVVTVAPEHRARVERSLGRASEVSREGDVTTLVIPVINRTTFVRRLYELGTRVRLVGPPEIRDFVREQLTAIVRGDA